MTCKCSDLSKTIETGKIDNEMLSTAMNAIKQHIQLPNLTAATSKQLLLRAADLLGDVLEKAFEIAQKHLAFTYYYWEDDKNKNSSIGIYQIVFNDNLYYILPNINYCSCDVYSGDVISGHLFTCHHVIACKISDLMERTHRVGSKVQEISDMIQSLAGLSSDL